jgi:hypothetical protein
MIAQLTIATLSFVVGIVSVVFLGIVVIRHLNSSNDVEKRKMNNDGQSIIRNKQKNNRHNDF